MTYPVSQIEYGTYQWLRREVGGFLGFGFDDGAWTHEQIGKVDSIIQSGYMQMLHPPPLPRGEGIPPASPHQWPFLTPVANLDLKTGQQTYELPDDLSDVVGEFSKA